MNRLRHLDIQTKIILVLVAVIVPTFLIVTVVQYKLTQPLLEEEWKQIGITTAESLATKVMSNRWLSRPNSTSLIENEIQMQIYLQPSIVRMDVYAKDPTTGNPKLVASNVEEDPAAASLGPSLVEKVTYEFKRDEEGMSFWHIKVPIRQGGQSARVPGRVVGMVHVLVSTKSVARLMDTFWKITAVAAAISVVVLILVLSYFLRKAVSNERLLRLAENQNLQLSQQLHETQRHLMNVEKFAVMGQLTANFAHEIGTPLNAISGHLQLLRDELAALPVPAPPAGGKGKTPVERLEIISGELARIESIVRGFLHTTSKPASQRQLVDLNHLIDKTVEIVRPRADSMGVELRCQLDRKLGPLRVVPLDIEQVLLNLVNNSLDSLETKLNMNERKPGRARAQLALTTRLGRENGEEYAELTVYDTGMGIPKEDLKNVLKPFFTTKGPGEGTGLGLSICQQLVGKYGGSLAIDAKEGAWAEVKVGLPYRTAV